MKLIHFRWNSEFGTRDTRWKIRSVTFPLYMIGQTLKIPLVQGYMQRSYSWRGSLNRESYNCYIRCREKSEETHVSVLTSRATVKNFSGVRLSRLGLTYWSSAWQRSCGNIRDHILFDAVSWSIYLLGSAFIFVMCNIRDSPDLILRCGRMLHQKKEKKKGSPRDISKTTHKHDFFLQKCYKKSFSNYDQKKKERKNKRKKYRKSWVLQVTLRPSDVLLVSTHNFLSRLLHLCICWFIISYHLISTYYSQIPLYLS